MESFKGKTYVMSDIHGRFKAMIKLLTDAKVDFTKDRIYFLGDYVDWGDNSLEVLRYLMLMCLTYSNVYCTIGNHDYMAYKCLMGNSDEISRLNSHTIGFIWGLNGGDHTLKRLSVACNCELDNIATWLRCLELQYEVTVGSKEFVLTHSCPRLTYRPDEYVELLVWKRVDEFDQSDWDRFCEVYGDATLVCGHTITAHFKIPEDGQKCEVYFSEERPYIGIDCGAKALGDGKYATLALLRLNDNKTWYSDIA
jgi:serine/threonine protein phosphatase 1